jgi:hypothetical protein
VRGADRVLAGYEPDDEGLRDALTYCDITTSPLGEPTTLAGRITEIQSRYGGSPDPAARQILEALRRSRPYLEQAVARTERRIHAVFADGPCAPYATTARRPSR